MSVHRVLAAFLAVELFVLAYAVDVVLRLGTAERTALTEHFLDPTLGRNAAGAPLSFALFVVPAAVLLFAAGAPRGRLRDRSRPR
ncbi:MAG: hypothetical protein DI556_13160 [Rhodovulum sulfidophilum]|uniref:Uncharacterized protein n=1 Tax=Rhodovulum sulfidophilum TaxID=35806 RepID=A0A2W5N5I9_RHOSU|nr:MAG: hypothetical protein DI556_13160 [Rhodovulum sulfidophilum]